MRLTRETQEFHAYDEGNLNWLAAHECESATLAMAARVWPKETLHFSEAQQRLRDSVLDAVDAFRADSGVPVPSRVLDVGCSVGVSTFYAADRYPRAAIDVSASCLVPIALQLMRLCARG